MKKLHILTILWTFLLAIPFTALSFGILVFLNEYLPKITATIDFPMIDWQELIVEGSARWPEVAGMIIGQLVIMIPLLFTKPSSRLRETT